MLINCLLLFLSFNEKLAVFDSPSLQFVLSVLCYLQETERDETKERFSTEFHPLIGLESHDVDVVALRKSWDNFRVGPRLLLDTSIHRAHNEQGCITKWHQRNAFFNIYSQICREQFVALHSEPILEELSVFLSQKYSYDDK